MKEYERVLSRGDNYRIFHPKQGMLNINDWVNRSVVNGPGERFVLWLQGCSLNCPGCINPELQPFIEKRLMKIDEVAKLILAVDGIDGVTFTGGEPFFQAGPLLELTKILHQNGLSVLAYSGFTFDQLVHKNDRDVVDLLACIDILIDGPFISGESVPLPWRGSRNQRVLFLSNQHLDWKEKINKPLQQIELVAGEKGWIMTGIWQKKLLNKINQYLHISATENKNEKK